MSNVSIVELDALEMEEMNGGGLVKDVYEAVKDLDRHWDSIKRRFKKGWDSYR
ncbi:hypothetical protein [Prevotella nigrescens]|jgi:hypothetical protein|uniref:hypothetical protein n=1 Tax=Prevotella nigrescens TaxID=28133 RepID=UPI0028DB4D7A|nr:hypothetical protein [Prevotella nigrescens]